jgi:hypothetical protein
MHVGKRPVVPYDGMKRGAFKLTNQMYTAYQLYIRSTGFNTIHREGRLFQEICVDLKYAQIEHERR